MGTYNTNITPMHFGPRAQAGYAAHRPSTGSVGAAPRHGGCSEDGGAADASGFSAHYNTASDTGTSGTHHRRSYMGGDAQDGFRGLARHGGMRGPGSGFGGAQQLTSSQRAEQMFGQFDTNGDGQITREELIAALDALRGAIATTTEPTTETTVTDTTDETSSDVAALDALLAEVDTPTTDVPEAPEFDDSTGTTVV